MAQQQQQQRERIRDRNLSIYGESSRSKGVSLSDCYDYRSINYLRKLPVIIIIITDSQSIQPTGAEQKYKSRRSNPVDR